VAEDQEGQLRRAWQEFAKAFGRSRGFEGFVVSVSRAQARDSASSGLGEARAEGELILGSCRRGPWDDGAALTGESSGRCAHWL